MMRRGANLEIHFYDNDRVGVHMEVASEQPTYTELLLFHLYVVRQLTNLGRTEPALCLAGMLAKLDAATLRALVHVDSQELPSLVSYSGKARKRFVASLRDPSGDARFNLNAKGFGVVAGGPGHYAPLSILMLIKYLVKEHPADFEYIHRLALAARNCGSTFLDGKLKNWVVDGAAHRMARELWVSAP
jgi:hypothetical protein